MNSFDFSTLYTSIPHYSLKIAITSLVKEELRVRGNKFLVVDKYGNAYWSDTPSTASYKASIREDSLIEMMEYLINNIYIKVDNKYLDNKWEFHWAQIMHHYWQIYFCSTMSMSI